MKFIPAVSRLLLCAVAGLLLSPSAGRAQPDAMADQGGPLPYAKEMLIRRNAILSSLTMVNKGSACYVQIFDSPRKLAVAITDTDDSDGEITAPAHGFATGDKVTLTGIANVAGGYARVVDADTFQVFVTRAEAMLPSGGSPLNPDPGDTGTVDLASNLTSPPVPEEYPLAGAEGAPSNVISYTQTRFKRGIYVRAVTAQNGSTAIAADDVKFTPRYSHGDIAKPASYED